jgi:hypothetical protein
MLENASGRGVRISVDRSLAPTPGFPAVVLRRGLSDSGASVNVSCMGGGTLRINALAAPDPFGAAGSSR